MTEQQFNEVMSTYKKGTYIKMMWQTLSENGYKLSQGVVRFTDITIKYNSRGEAYVIARTTKNKRLIVHTQYFDNAGTKISKQKYEANNPKFIIVDYMAKHLDDIISLR